MPTKTEKLTLPAALLVTIVAGITISHILFQAAAVFLLFYWFVEFRAGNSIHMPLMEKFVFLYFVSGVIAVFLTENPLGNLPHLMPHIVLLSAIPLNWRFNREGFPEGAIIAVILFFTSIAALAGVVFHFGGVERTHGFNGGYFTLASVMAFSIPMVLAESFRQERSLGRNGLFLLSVVHLFAMWWTFTRSAFLGFLGAMGIWLVADAWRELRRSGVFTLSGAVTARLVLMMVLLTLIFTAKDSRINPFYHPPKSVAGKQLDLTSGRASIYQDARQFIQQDWQQGHWVNILLGHGLNSRNRMVQSKFTSWESDYLQAYMNQGIMGLLLVMVIYVLFLKRVFAALMSDNVRRQGVAAAGLAFWLMSFFTLKLTGFTDAAIFAVLVVLLQQIGRTEERAGNP